MGASACLLVMMLLTAPVQARTEVSPEVLHLTDRRDDGVRLFGPLGPDGPGAHALTIGSPTGEPVDLPFVVDALVWRRDAPEEQDMRFMEDALVRLVFRTGMLGIGGLNVALESHGPKGAVDAIAVARAAADRETLFLRVATTGHVVPAGHTLGLRITADEAPTLAALAYGTPEADSFVQVVLGPVDRPVPALRSTAVTDPLADADRDGYLDGAEARTGSDPRDPLSRPADEDVDGLPDAAEATSGTSPIDPDSDQDGLVDCLEDTDRDGLTHCQEAALGTDPLRADTDGDGFLDGLEHRRGHDPMLQSDFPTAIDAHLLRDLLTLTLFALGVAVLTATGLAIARTGTSPRHDPTPRAVPLAPRFIPHDHGEHAA